MDELELFKKEWQKKGEDLPKLSYEEIYKMLWKRSSSIVKWIFYISLIEFVFWISLDLVATLTGFRPQFDFPNSDIFLWSMYAIFYPVILYFIYSFYKNYNRINTTDNVKGLMNSIIKTRKTVKQYVWFNLIFFFLFSGILYLLLFKYDPTFFDLNGNESLNFYMVLILSIVLTLLFFSVLIWLFYRLIYGILLKRLHKNYRELEDLDL
ncbi:hypothetical protein [Robertkochia aurantiaca]|uniref:hypothetical protein n=1 Tax=Robertkochia aurantiaca TaxID=2873700 RepID=UPI001CD00384|nr:hypothetical protein [Robertkochia sp. 3YJGBD-33]